MCESNLIFIVGVQRSGTTLTRNILNAHPNIAVPFECAFYKLLSEKYEETGFLEDSIEEFVEDLQKIKRFDLWKLGMVELKEFLNNQGQELAYSRIVRLIVEAYRKKFKPEASIVGIKNPNGIYHLPFIFKHWPDARVIHVIRDPRGVLGSVKKKHQKTNNCDFGEIVWKVYRRYRHMMEVYDK